MATAGHNGPVVQLVDFAGKSLARSRVVSGTLAEHENHSRR